MKTHKVQTFKEWRGMHSSDPADRIEDVECALLKNGYCDRSGRVVKSHGVSIVATAESLRMVNTDPRTRIYSLHTYEGRVGEFPDSRELVVFGSGLLRSQANDLRSAWDLITFPADITAPLFNRPAAGVFRDKFFYHQNGFDVPFRIKCEEEGGAVLTLQAETLGLKPPPFGLEYLSTTAGNQRRFPPLVHTSYAITYVYGTRGESGPSLEYVLELVTTQDEINFQNIPLGPTGCTARRIYRSEIGRGTNFTTGGANILKNMERGPKAELFLLHEIPDNTTTTFTDKQDDSSLDYLTRCPRPRPFPYRAKYQQLHLDRIFGANLKEHPWTLGVIADPTLAAGSPFTNMRVSISNTGNGTITFEAFNAGWGAWLTIANYKTLTLRAILTLMLASATNALAASYTTGGVAAIPQAGLDLDRIYVFNEVSNEEIFGGENVYWFFAQDDVTGAEGPQTYPNRITWSEIAFVEQIDPFASTDITRFGSKRITGFEVLDNVPTVTTDTDTYFLSGDFIPDTFGVPNFRVDRSQASHGSICIRPDAMLSIPGVGNLMVAHDALRKFRGESSVLAGLGVRDWFDRVLREPPSRDQVSMVYHAGEFFIALPTDGVK